MKNYSTAKMFPNNLKDNERTPENLLMSSIGKRATAATVLRRY